MSSLGSTAVALVDHITVSGWRDVVVISVGNWSCLPKSTLIFYFWSEEKSLGIFFNLVLLLPSPSLTKLMCCSTGGKHPCFPVCAPPAPRIPFSGPGHDTICSAPVKVRSCSLTRCAGGLCLERCRESSISRS